MGRYTKKHNILLNNFSKCIKCRMKVYTKITNRKYSLCYYCNYNLKEISLKKVKKLKKLQNEHTKLWSYCQECQQSLCQEIPCKNFDCPIFYRRAQSKRDLINILRAFRE